MRLFTFRVILLAMPVLIGSYALAQTASVKKKVEALRSSLKSNDEQERAKAAIDLSKIGAEAVSAVPDLVELMQKDPEPSVRSAAIRATAWIYFLDKTSKPETTVVPAMIKALKDDDTVVRWAAADGLGHLDRRASVAAPELLKLMFDKDDGRMQEIARRSFRFVIGPECEKLTPGLLKMYKFGIDDPQNEFAVLLALGVIGAQEKEVVPLLTDVLKQKNPKNPNSRAAAAYGLEHLGARAEPALPVLIDALKESMKLEKRDPRNVCNPVLRALGAIGPPAKEALPLICEVIEASDNKDISRKSHAERAYQKISGIKLDPLGKIRMP